MSSAPWWTLIIGLSAVAIGALARLVFKSGPLRPDGRSIAAAGTMLILIGFIGGSVARFEQPFNWRLPVFVAGLALLNLGLYRLPGEIERA
jgi:hypothetical protein